MLTVIAYETEDGIYCPDCARTGWGEVIAYITSSVGRVGEGCSGCGFALAVSGDFEPAEDESQEEETL